MPRQQSRPQALSTTHDPAGQCCGTALSEIVAIELRPSGEDRSRVTPAGQLHVAWEVLGTAKPCG